MFKLFINNIQIGNYRSMKDMLHSVAMSSCLGGNVSKLYWEGRSCFITTRDRYSFSS